MDEALKQKHKKKCSHIKSKPLVYSDEPEGRVGRSYAAFI